jgi:hypothetical protein
MLISKKHGWYSLHQINVRLVLFCSKNAIYMLVNIFRLICNLFISYSLHLMKTNSTNKTMTGRSMGLVVMPEDSTHLFVNKVFYSQGSSSEIRMEKGPIRLGDKIDIL